MNVDKEQIMECIGKALAGEQRILYGHRVKVIGYDHSRHGILIQYTDTKELVVLNRIHDVRRLI
jgi:hypothetical protein